MTEFALSSDFNNIVYYDEKVEINYSWRKVVLLIKKCINSPIIGKSIVYWLSRFSFLDI